MYFRVNLKMTTLLLLGASLLEYLWAEELSQNIASKFVGNLTKTVKQF